MTDTAPPPQPNMAVKLSNSSSKTAVYEYDGVLIFLKPGVEFTGVFPGSDGDPVSTGTVPKWPKLDRL